MRGKERRVIKEAIKWRSSEKRNEKRGRTIHNVHNIHSHRGLTSEVAKEYRISIVTYGSREKWQMSTEYPKSYMRKEADECRIIIVTEGS